nr:universal stress protein [uncultured Cupriavidus sp.]
MYDTILVTIDGSACGDCALKEAIDLASAVHARLDVLHVVESGYETGVHEELVRRGHKLLAEARAMAEARGLPCTMTLDEVEHPTGDVASVISQTLEKDGAQLLVLGTHGRRGINRLLMGSVAEKLVRSAPTPVLLVRMDKRANGA